MVASKGLDSSNLLCALAGDVRLVERLCSADLLPLGSRILPDYASRDADRLPRSPPGGCRQSIPDDHRAQGHSCRSGTGNYRVHINLASDLLTIALDRGCRASTRSSTSISSDSRLRRNHRVQEEVKTMVVLPMLDDESSPLSQGRHSRSSTPLSWPPSYPYAPSTPPSMMSRSTPNTISSRRR